jgi:hypothetical protein
MIWVNSGLVGLACPDIASCAVDCAMACCSARIFFTAWLYSSKVIVLS